MTTPIVPPTCELFDIHQLAERHPNLLTESRLRWALRNRHSNGLKGAIYASRGGELLVHEPSFLQWWLGLAGRHTPRATNRKRSRVAC